MNRSDNAPVRSLPCGALVAVLLVATACGGPPPPRATSAPVEVGAFVVRLGADTVALEEFSRSATRIEGRQVIRTPRTSVREFSGDLGADGTLRRFEMTAREPGAEQASMRASVEWSDGTARVEIERAQGTDRFEMESSPGSLPFLGYSVSLYELALGRLRAGDEAVIRSSMIPLGASSPYVLELERGQGDTVIVTNIAGPNLALVDPDGRLLSWDGRGTTLAVTADRDVRIDIDRYAREYAARDAAGQGLGSLSPRDTTSAEVGGVGIQLVYGRPSARGREIFGGVVPWGETWRTGANQATTLRLDGDLLIGGTRVPAGEYSIFTVPGPDSWELIVNRRTGQWGTDHDPAEDVVRVAMTTRALDATVEQLTISVEPTSGGAAELRIEWDTVRAAAEVRAP
jgi:hypothetical protein